jgi:hypothetical protein
MEGNFEVHASCMHACALQNLVMTMKKNRLRNKGGTSNGCAGSIHHSAYVLGDLTEDVAGLTGSLLIIQPKLCFQATVFPGSISK